MKFLKVLKFYENFNLFLKFLKFLIFFFNFELKKNYFIIFNFFDWLTGNEILSLVGQR